MTKREMNTAWGAAVKAAATARKLPHGSGWVATVDDLFFSSTIVTVHDRRAADGTWSAPWSTKIKPLVVDEMLWTTLRHDSDVATRKVNVRVRAMGAFALYGLALDWSTQVVDGDGVDIAAAAEAALDAHEARAQTFREQTPDLEAFAVLVDAHREEYAHVPHVMRLERAFLAVALGDLGTARRLADDAIAHHERGYVVGDRSVWQRLVEDMDAGDGVFAP